MASKPVTVEEAIQIARQKGFASIELNKQFTLLPANKSMSSFGFVRLSRNPSKDAFYARVPASEIEWTAFFAEVRAHALTKKKVAHQFNDQLATAPPGNGQFAELMNSNHQKRLAGLVSNPIHNQNLIGERSPITRGDVILHACRENDRDRTYKGYRMKTANLERNDTTAFFMDWEMLCEFATTWGRDQEILLNHPWGADPIGEIHPDPESGFIGFKTVVPFRPDPRNVIAQPLEKPYVPPIVSKEAPVITATTPTEVVVSEEAPVVLESTQELLHYGTKFLDSLSAIAGQDDLEVFAQTLRPAAETLMRLLGEKGILAPDIPDLSAIVTAKQKLAALAEADERLAQRVLELDAQQGKLDTREAELAKLAEQLSVKEQEQTQLLAMIEESVAEMFAKTEAELVERQAKIHAEANRLDSLKAELREALN